MITKISTNTFEHVIDGNDNIIDISDSWLAFADDNDIEYSRESIIGKPLWDFVSNAPTRHIYKVLLKKIRKQGDYIQLPFRCDAPDRRRFMEIDISLLANGDVRFLSRIIKTELRPVVPLLDSKLPRSDKILNMCSWCKQIQVDSRLWMEVEHAVIELELFDLEVMPKLSHGICPDCEQRLLFSMNLKPLQVRAS